MTEEHFNPEEKILFSSSMLKVLSNNIFSNLDTKLRVGRHICDDNLELYEFISDNYHDLERFYRLYNVELVKAPEGFFYLLPKSTSILPRSTLSELDMLVGKILCYLYLSPNKIANQAIFEFKDVFDELLSLVDIKDLVKLLNVRRTGSDLDKEKLAEKVGQAIHRLKRMGVVYYINNNNKKFFINKSCFRFGADVRISENPQEAQLRLIQKGEAVNAESLEEEKHLKIADALLAERKAQDEAQDKAQNESQKLSNLEKEQISDSLSISDELSKEKVSFEEISDKRTSLENVEIELTEQEDVDAIDDETITSIIDEILADEDDDEDYFDDLESDIEEDEYDEEEPEETK